MVQKNRLLTRVCRRCFFCNRHYSCCRCYIVLFCQNNSCWNNNNCDHYDTSYNTNNNSHVFSSDWCLTKTKQINLLLLFWIYILRHWDWVRCRIYIVRDCYTKSARYLSMIVVLYVAWKSFFYQTHISRIIKNLTFCFFVDQ
jgi:hypothetical protein